MSLWANYAAAVSLTSDHPPYGKGYFLCVACIVTKGMYFYPLWSEIGIDFGQFGHQQGMHGIYTLVLKWVCFF